ncbi:MAG: hypothetical protein WCY41_04585 [Candidatus Micrarchaeia archaeon]
MVIPLKSQITLAKTEARRPWRTWQSSPAFRILANPDRKMSGGGQAFPPLSYFWRTHGGAVIHLPHPTFLRPRSPKSSAPQPQGWQKKYQNINLAREVHAWTTAL